MINHLWIWQLIRNSWNCSLLSRLCPACPRSLRNFVATSYRSLRGSVSSSSPKPILKISSHSSCSDTSIPLMVFHQHPRPALHTSWIAITGIENHPQRSGHRRGCRWRWRFPRPSGRPQVTPQSLGIRCFLFILLSLCRLFLKSMV